MFNKFLSKPHHWFIFAMSLSKRILIVFILTFFSNLVTIDFKKNYLLLLVVLLSLRCLV